ncbi:hypothetical protein GGTG_11805 [Gaeumannomyces tritici R3-111a-1]|uniref:Uncharacterized protein n=1 Tax=Gaeumannomyces tritici (strain R3-111a-1) TaxID=644352 RepID=J3PE82_GAET3|nr:hypothetical protein GGTG_11805 [Gaeumannomyces tritici R3-111a-1]EJT70782.1 hypothetical protein GGTG_11805 [Gaeumannomyces tritici R3-111a-1]
MAESRFAGSSYAAQPKNAFSVEIPDPFVNVGEKVHAGIGVAIKIVLVCLGIECSAFRD